VIDTFVQRLDDGFVLARHWPPIGAVREEFTYITVREGFNDPRVG
jgi:hypothetical protein